jgi:hypothetical protein
MNSGKAGDQGPVPVHLEPDGKPGSDDTARSDTLGLNFEMEIRAIHSFHIVDLRYQTQPLKYLLGPGLR